MMDDIIRIRDPVNKVRSAMGLSQQEYEVVKVPKASREISSSADTLLELCQADP